MSGGTVEFLLSRLVCSLDLPDQLVCLGTAVNVCLALSIGCLVLCGLADRALDIII